MTERRRRSNNWGEERRIYPRDLVPTGLDWTGTELYDTHM
jgi:hypothetical protein